MFSGGAFRMPGGTFNNEGTFSVGSYVEAKKIDNSRGNFVCNSPEITIKVQEFTGFDRANLAVVRRLTLIGMESDLQLDNLLQQAPNLEKLILNNCSGLLASPANLQAYHQLRLRGIGIELEGMQDFQNSYDNRYPSEANVMLPQTMAVSENIVASNTTNLANLRRDNGNFEQFPAAGRIE